jgi:hypothetical protein
VVKRAALGSPPVLCRELHLYAAPLDIGVAFWFRTEKSPPTAFSLVILCTILQMDFREFFPTFMCVVQAHILDDAHGG